MCLISSLSGTLSGTDAAPHGVWIVFCYISEICSPRARFPSAPYLSGAHPNLAHVCCHFAASRSACPLLLKLFWCLMNPSRTFCNRLLFHIKLSILSISLLSFATATLFTQLLSLSLYNVLLMESQNIASITLRLFNLVLFFSSAFL